MQNEGDFFSLTGKLLSRSTGAKSYVGALPVEEHRKTKKRRMTEPPPRYIHVHGSKSCLCYKTGVPHITETQHI